jgi:hypothetical protein
MFKYLFSFALLICSLSAKSQDTLILNHPMARNTIYLEVFGQGLFNSLSYDRILFPEFRVKHSANIGLTFIPPISYMQVVAVPVSYNFIFGQRNHHLELGLGFTPMIFKEIGINSSFYVQDQIGNQTLENEKIDNINLLFYLTPKIGYRLQKSDGGFFFRATLTPPIAGINIWRYSSTSSYSQSPSTEYFTSAAFFGSRVYPWAGVSFGYTFD